MRSISRVLPHLACTAVFAISTLPTASAAPVSFSSSSPQSSLSSSLFDPPHASSPDNNRGEVVQSSKSPDGLRELKFVELREGRSYFEATFVDGDHFEPTPGGLIWKDADGATIAAIGISVDDRGIPLDDIQFEGNSFNVGQIFSTYQCVESYVADVTISWGAEALVCAPLAVASRIAGGACAAAALLGAPLVPTDNAC